MRLTFLGTGTSQGIPVIACPCPVCQSDNPHDMRLRTAALVEHGGVTVAIDAGPDFRQQMLREKVKSLNAILITHEHRDHISGLDDVRAFNWISQRPMDIWAEPRAIDAIKTEYSYAFAEHKYPGIPEICLNEINGQPFNVEGLRITPLRVYHHKLPIYGFRIGNLTYITDANFIGEEEKQKIIGTKLLVVNALRMEKHLSHYSLPEALALVAELKPHRAYITHVGHQMGLYNDVAPRLPRNVCLAYDGLTVEC